MDWLHILALVGAIVGLVVFFGIFVFGYILEGEF